jgi:hypothetical protein
MKATAVKLLIAVILVFSLNPAIAKDKELTPEKVVAAHIKSIGDHELLTKIINRGISGKSSVKFIQGGVGTLDGQCLIVSSGHNLSIILKYGGLQYPGEYFAYDGTDVEVSTITPGQRSPLADFIFRYKRLMKEGLLGGVWSLGWPLMEIAKRNPALKYASAKIDGHELHAIDYSPQGGFNNIKVKLFFEPDTFRHVRTEYRLTVRGEQALQAGQTVTRGVATSAGSGPITREAGVLDAIPDSHYLLIEKFDNFKEVQFNDPKFGAAGSLIMPHAYSLEYSVEGQGSSFLAHWDQTAEQFIYNGKLDPSVFKAH